MLTPVSLVLGTALDGIFFACLVLCIVIITASPVIVTWLPDAVMGAQK